MEFPRNHIGISRAETLARNRRCSQLRVNGTVCRTSVLSGRLLGRHVAGYAEKPQGGALGIRLEPNGLDVAKAAGADNRPPDGVHKIDAFGETLSGDREALADLHLEKDCRLAGAALYDDRGAVVRDDLVHDAGLEQRAINTLGDKQALIGQIAPGQRCISGKLMADGE